MMSPTNREFYDDGRWATGGTNKNQQSASFYEAFYDREMAQNRFGGNFKLEWTIIDGLKATAQYAIFDDNYRGSYYAKGQVGETPNYISTTRSTTETRTQTTKDSFNGDTGMLQQAPQVPFPTKFLSSTQVQTSPLPTKTRLRP